VKWFWMFASLGLILGLGANACTASEPPALASAGELTPSGSAAPSQTAASLPPTPSTTPSATALPSQTALPSITASPLPPSATPTPLACWSEPGRIESGQLESEWIEDPLSYLVYLPPCYDQQPERYYPSLYLFHGQTYRSDHWLNLGAAELADRLIAAGELPPFVMIFPYDQDHYTYPPQNQFGEAVFYDLLPAIDRAYRTLPEREMRAIGGISRGGNWALHIGLPHPGFFGAIGLHSTPVFSTDTNDEIRAWLAAIPADELPRLFVDAGEKDRWLEYTLIFEQVLTDENFPHEWYLYPGRHEDAYWAAHLEQYLRWYAQDW
jgi:enterochelin esterase-like enzyme